MDVRGASLYLVTGGAGFIGSNIVERLVEQGERACLERPSVAQLPEEGQVSPRVRVLDNFSTGKRKNLAPWLDRIELIEGDIRDPETVKRAMEGVDYVLHQAALPSVPWSIADPLTTHEANVTGTLNVLIAARETGVQRLVYASSCAVYGDDPQLPKHEDMPTISLSPYATSKLAGEHYCQAFTQVYGLETVCLRYFNVFGPRQDPASQYAAVVPKFVTAMLDGRRPVIYGDGTQSRDFTYVENVVEANLLACRAKGVTGEVFNMACGECFTLLELMERLEQVVGKQVEPEFVPSQPGDIKHSLAGIEKASERLGYTPMVRFDEGIRRTVAFFCAGDGKQS